MDPYQKRKLTQNGMLEFSLCLRSWSIIKKQKKKKKWMWKSQSEIWCTEMSRDRDTLINVHNGSKDQSKSILIIRLLIMYFPFPVCSGCQPSHSFIVWIGKVSRIMYAEHFYDKTFYCLNFDIHDLYYNKENKSNKKLSTVVVVWFSPTLSLALIWR